MRFGGSDREQTDERGQAEPIDYRCFVAALAAAQAGTPTARIAGTATSAGSAEHQTRELHGRAGGGSFHLETASSLASNGSATKVKPPFTVAF